MSKFQIILLVLIGFIAIVFYVPYSTYLNDVVELKQEELLNKEKQDRIVTCKYLLSNETLILERENKLLREMEIAYQINAVSKEDFERTRENYALEVGEYNNSSNNCREFLRNLENPKSPIKSLEE